MFANRNSIVYLVTLCMCICATYGKVLELINSKPQLKERRKYLDLNDWNYYLLSVAEIFSLSISLSVVSERFGRNGGFFVNFASICIGGILRIFMNIILLLLLPVLFRFHWKIGSKIISSRWEKEKEEEERVKEDHRQYIRHCDICKKTYIWFGIWHSELIIAEMVILVIPCVADTDFFGLLAKEQQQQKLVDFIFYRTQGRRRQPLHWTNICLLSFSLNFVSWLIHLRIWKSCVLKTWKQFGVLCDIDRRLYGFFFNMSCDDVYLFKILGLVDAIDGEGSHYSSMAITTT